ncbi:MAG TPA: flavodoxin family protein [Candidatus Merdivicinus excrementipullorum]|uniref:Flavodoxin family protein n=1 Tax=Candidatus Merdivicinus excrementipullorum TaxID=2840867 RepID=A0A9D1FPK6_9FIRM|nr:flavodoxin family protein [Candidatus Merdivicinus excrementipullorum]
MKVLLLNGSPHPHGCTFTALSEVAKTLEENGVEAEILQIGAKPVRGCIACGGCAGKGRCAFGDDIVNTLIEKMEQADGFIVGSPVYYASANGAVECILDRAFYAGGKAFVHKPAAAVASARRAGTTATLDELTKYFTISQMPVVSSTYWPMVHGNKPEDVAKDEEGLQVMRNLGRNMAWLLKCIEAGKQAGVQVPEAERQYRTNFIR